jgi:hypothetical protein
MTFLQVSWGSACDRCKQGGSQTLSPRFHGAGHWFICLVAITVQMLSASHASTSSPDTASPSLLNGHDMKGHVPDPNRATLRQQAQAGGPAWAHPHGMLRCRTGVLGFWWLSHEGTLVRAETLRGQEEGGRRTPESIEIQSHRTVCTRQQCSGSHRQQLNPMNTILHVCL